jgi:hypothetical protein
LFLLKDFAESQQIVREGSREATAVEAKTQQKQGSVVSCLTKPRRGIKANAALLIKGVNRWRTD